MTLRRRRMPLPRKAIGVPTISAAKLTGRSPSGIILKVHINMLITRPLISGTANIWIKETLMDVNTALAKPIIAKGGAATAMLVD